MNLFVEPNVIWIGLAVVLGLGLLFWQSQRIRRRRIDLLISAKLRPSLVPSWSPALQRTKITLLLISVSLLFIALARPQWGTEKKKTAPTGIDILIALDVSKSMLARDVRPNRLERVKLGMTNLLDRVQGDRLGLIAFSGTAFLQCPLTLDHHAFSKTLNDLEVGIIKTHGTDLAGPIEEASRSFSKKDRDRFLILLSDGEDLEGKGLKRAKEAKEEGIRVFTIGIGSPNGSKIPMDPIGQPARNFLKDPQGKTIISRMDEKSLKDIAEATGGQYYSLGPTGEGLAEVLEHLQKIGQQKKREQLSTELPIDRYQPLVIISLLFLVLEMLTSSGKRHLLRAGMPCILLLSCLLAGCLKQDNVKKAEDAMKKGDPATAASFYMAEINASDNQKIDPRLFVNAGLAHLEAGSLKEAEEALESALDASIDDPELQSKALNALGNIFYLRANKWLDQKNVNQARKSWKQALKHYESASLLDGNSKANQNLNSLKKQLDERINALICLMAGKIWRDLNGDGQKQKEEPNLQGFVYWDKDGNGEHNKTVEPIVKTNEEGLFAFEWISHEYPTPIRLGSKLLDTNRTAKELLLPVFPPPPPPENPSLVRNYFVSIEKPGQLQIPMPYRAAPMLRGNVWNDENGNGIREQSEGGIATATLFLDQNGNFQADENETSFKPAKDGAFMQAVPPGQYSLCIQPDNPDANVTFPLDDKKAHLAWVDFESAAANLDFGIQDQSNQQEHQDSSNPEQNQSQESQPQSPENSDESQEQKGEDAQEPLPQEVNALYERLLQEMESKSEPLQQERRAVNSKANGRDY